MTAIIGERSTRTYQLLVWRKAIELEIKGIRMSQSLSVSKIASEALGMKPRTRRQKVLDKLNEHIQDVQDGKCNPCTMRGE